MSDLVQHLRRAVLECDEAGLSDGQLLKCYLEHRDEAAVAALVRRHGQMVWGVCRRLLGNHHDAEDAFQAAFLVLVRKAASVKQRDRVGGWLYGVACQTARKARAIRARRRTREKQVEDMPDAEAPEQDVGQDLRQMLDLEVCRLPEKYRVALVLCELQGRTRKEAAQQLGLPEGTLAGRLTRGRALLARRLARHGLALSGAGLSASAPAALVSATIKAAGATAAGQAARGVVPGAVVALTEGVLRAMLMTKLKVVTMALLVVGLVALATGMLATARTSARGDGEENAAARDDRKAREGGGGKESPFTVAIKAQKTRVRIKEPSQVDLRVVNSSQSSQSFRVMSNSWDQQWECSNERVTWKQTQDVWRDILQTVKLKPGEAYEKTLPMFLQGGKPGEKVSFRMGFTPLLSKRTYWSNELTVQVEPEGKADGADKKGDGVAKKLWAGMSVNQPLFREGFDTNLLQFNFAVVNESDQVINPKLLGYPRLIVNGKERAPTGMANGPGDKRAEALPPGDNYQFGLGAGEDFAKPGLYRVYWQGEGFRSNEVVFRVLPKETPAKQQAQKLDGAWTVVNEDGFRKGEKWVIKDGRIIEGEKDSLFRFYQVKPDRTPREIDITVMAQPDGRPVQIIQGIYSLGGDELRLCFPATGKQRPAAFPKKSAPGQVIVLERQKP